MALLNIFLSQTAAAQPGYLTTLAHQAGAPTQVIPKTSSNTVPLRRIVWGSDNTLPPQHASMILVGRPGAMPMMARFLPAIKGFSIQNGQWIDTHRQQPVHPNAGLVFWLPNPQHPDTHILMVTGNSAQGVRRAARYLTTTPRPGGLAGWGVLVTQNWQPGTTESFRMGPYLSGRSRQFDQLGIPSLTAYGMRDPILMYPLTVLSDFRTVADTSSPSSSSPSTLWINLVYSYAAGLDPALSSLELRLNGQTIAGLPLDSPSGRARTQQSVRVPGHLVQPYNALEAVFHFTPESGFPPGCVPPQQFWGKIYKDSRFRVEGPVPTVRPDVGRFLQTGFPLTRTHHFESLHVVMPEHPPKALLQTLLTLLTRAGSVTRADTGLRLSMGTTTDPLPKDRDVLWLETASVGYTEQDTGGWISQTAHGSDGGLITRLWAATPQGWALLSRVLSGVLPSAVQTTLALPPETPAVRITSAGDIQPLSAADFQRHVAATLHPNRHPKASDNTGTHPLFLTLLGSIMIGALTGIGWILWRQRRKTPPPPSAKPSEPSGKSE